MASHSSQQTLEKFLNLDIIQTIKDISTADKRKASENSAKITATSNNLKAMQQALKEFIEENKILRNKNMELQQQIDDKIVPREELTQLIKNAISEEIQRTMREEIREEILQEVQKAVKDTLNERNTQPCQEQQTVNKSYAETAAFPPLPKSKPTLVLSSADENFSAAIIKQQLNMIPSKDLGLLQCATTKMGKILIQCENEEKLQNLKNALDSNNDLKENIHITESRPRRLQVIIFGAPEAPGEHGKLASNTDKSQEIQDYMDNFISTTLARILRKTPDYNLKKIQPNRRGTVNLIIDLPEHDADILIRKGKAMFGFNHCSIRRFILVRRCFKCQRFDHTSHNCPNSQTCAFCSEEHNSDNCPQKDNRENYNCINCKEGLQKIPSNDQRRTLLKTNHCCFDSSCRTYKSKFDEIKSKIDRVYNNQNSRFSNKI